MINNSRKILRGPGHRRVLKLKNVSINPRWPVGKNKGEKAQGSSQSHLRDLNMGWSLEGSTLPENEEERMRAPRGRG